MYKIIYSCNKQSSENNGPSVHSNMADTHECNTKQKMQVTEECFNFHTVKNSMYIEFKNMQNQTVYCSEMQIYVIKP